MELAENEKELTGMNILVMLRTLSIGLLGAFLFEIIGLPMPWMLGSMFAVMAIRLSTQVNLSWHPLFRNIGLVITGYTIGFAFTLEAVQEMIDYFPMMLGINIFFFFLFLIISTLMAYRTNMNRGTALTCCVPGGLQQIITFAEEEKQMNLSLVTFYHVLRILMIVTIVPFIVSTEQTQLAQHIEVESYSILLFALLLLCYAAGMLFKKIRVPTAYLLGPVFFIMCLNLANMNVPAMPDSMLQIAQLVIGIYFGLLLRKADLNFSKKHLFYAFLSSGTLIAAAVGISIWLSNRGSLSSATSFLSAIPGGLDQMGIIAASIQADVTIVTAFQLFRILFLSVFVIPFVKYIVNLENEERGRL